MGGKEDRKVPLKPVLHVLRAMAKRVIRPHGHVSDFPRAVIHSAQIAAVVATVNDVRVFRTRSKPATLGAGRGLPVALADREIVAATQNSDSGIILLGAEDAIRKVIVGHNAIELSGGLILISGPLGASVHRDLSAA